MYPAAHGRSRKKEDRDASKSIYGSPVWAGDRGRSSFAAEARPGNLKYGLAHYRSTVSGATEQRWTGKGPHAASLSVRPTDFHTYLSRVKDDLGLDVTIRRGRKLTAMHEGDSLLTDQQVSDLITYIRSAVPHLEVTP